MATKTWYLNQRTYGTTNYLFLDPNESDVPSGINRSDSGWEQGRNSAGDTAWMDNGNEVRQSEFVQSTTAPDFSSFNVDTPTGISSEFHNIIAAVNPTITGTSGIGIPRTAVMFTVPFNAIVEGESQWTLTLDVAANSRAWPGSAQGRLILEAYKIYMTDTSGLSVFPTQLGFSETGSDYQVSDTVTGLSTNVNNKQTVTLNYTPTGVDPNSGWRLGYWETYLGTKTEATSRSGFLALALGWEVVTQIGGGGANNRCDVNILYGTGTNSKLVSAPFRKKVYAAT